MNRLFQFCCLLVGHLISCPSLHAQSDKLLEYKKKVQVKIEATKYKLIANKTTEDWLANSPVSTSFDDATYEIDLLSAFEPTENEYGQLAAQPRDPSGGFVLHPGTYTMTARSFCLKAGTHGPSQGDGHLYAPLRGKRADFVQQILLRYGQKPEVPQREVQVLLWAVIAGADMNEMAEPHRKTLNRLFSVGDLIKFKAQHWLGDKVDHQIDNATGPLRSMIQAESQMRELMKSANAKYEDFERIAMLAGPAPPEHMIRHVSKGRWSYHTDGYFVRYFPIGYSRTRVDVMVPPDVHTSFDQWGRIKAFNDPSIGRVELEYEAEIFAAGSVEGYNQYISKLKTLTVNGTTMPLKTPLDMPFVTRDTVPILGSVAGEEALAHSYEQAMVLQKMTPASAGLGLSLATSPAMLRLLLNAIRLGSALDKVMECCSAENTPDCILQKVNQNWLLSTMLQFLGGQTGTTDGAAEHGTGVVFNPSRSMAVPANRSSQRIGMAPIPVDPPPPSDVAWLKKIPPCPCHYDEAAGATQSPEGKWQQCGAAAQEYHYGATYEVRWIPTASDAPGQQCTYSLDKKLIGYGLAAGSADFRSPGICKWEDDRLRAFVCAGRAGKHWWYDVEDWNDISCEEYTRMRPSSHELCAAKNPVNDWHFGQMCVFVKDFTCPEIRDVFKQFRDAQDVPLAMKHFMEKGQVESIADIAVILAFLEKREEEEPFTFSGYWRQVFASRVRIYLKDYQKNGKNPPACQPTVD